MFSLEIQNEKVCFKDIKPEHLPRVLQWYNMTEDFRFATGIDTPLTLEEIQRKYAEVAICCYEFFCGIYLCNQLKMIGILKGSLWHEDKDAVWLSSLVIDPECQNRGYGGESVNLLLNYLKLHHGIKNAYLSVIEENYGGMRFWMKLGFRELRKIDRHYKMQDKKLDVIIMGKQL